MKRLAYTGSSWAARGFDNPVEQDPNGGTNLVKELNLQVTNLSEFSSSNSSCYEKLKNHNDKFDAVLWVYCEPFNEISPGDLSLIIKKENWIEVRKDINYQILKKINGLGCPVGLIGGPSDVFDCDFDNITVIHPSWQKFLAEQNNVDLDLGWGADVAHSAIVYNQDTAPCRSAVQAISDTFKSWNQLELYGLFRWVHPNTKGNQLFAKEIKHSVKCFIDGL